MAFRPFQPATQFFTNDGLVLAGGSLTFTDSGTTTPRTTWSDPAMTTPNANPVPLDGAGRPNTDIWCEGLYRVVLKDALGATLVTLDNVSGPVGIPNPALQSGKFLTNDGTVVSWALIRQVPDATGQPDGNVLTSDGAGNIAWEALPTTRQVPDPNASGVVDGWVLTRDDASPGDYAWKALEATPGSLTSEGNVTFSNGLMMQWGVSGTVGPSNSLAVVFPTPFLSQCFNVQITANASIGSSQSHDSVFGLLPNQFSINNRATLPSTFYWFAIGV